MRNRVTISANAPPQRTKNPSEFEQSFQIPPLSSQIAHKNRTQLLINRSQLAQNFIRITRKFRTEGRRASMGILISRPNFGRPIANRGLSTSAVTVIGSSSIAVTDSSSPSSSPEPSPSPMRLSLPVRFGRASSGFLNGNLGEMSLENEE